MSDFRDANAMQELATAIDALASAGGFDRGRVASGLARLVERQAKFHALRHRFDPRFDAATRSNGARDVGPR